MLNLKKTAVAVLAFASSTAFAGTMGPVCAPDNVTVPCEKSAWSVGAKALYLQPTYTGALSFLGDNPSISSTSIDSSPKWGWGFQIEGGYHFNTGNDLNLNWYHLGGKTAHSFLPAAVTPELGAASLASKPRWDAVNLELGQHVDFGKVKDIRFHGGVQYGRIKTEIGAATATTVTGTEMRYTGFGPRVGADMGYALGNGLGVYANAATALLVGNSRTQAGEINTQTGAIQYGSLKSTIVVPEVEAKLGLNYDYAMAQGDLGLDVGYMWVNYFNAQQLSSLSTSNFGVHGPYVGLKWVGNV